MIFCCRKEFWKNLDSRSRQCL